MPVRRSYDAVSFDVYGTLLNWEPEVGGFLLNWASENGLNVAERELLEAYDRLRQPLQEHRPAIRYPDVLMRTLDAVGEEFDTRVPEPTRTAFGKIAATHAPFPDSAPALGELKTMGLTLAALSNIDDASFETAIQRAGISFDVVVTTERVKAYKPDHAHFLAALTDLLGMGIMPDRVLHVAQSRRADIVPAKALGLTCVWVDRPGHVFGRTGRGAEQARPDLVVEDLAALVQHLKSL